MGKSFTNIKGRTSNKKAAGQKKIRPRVVTAVTTRSIRVLYRSQLTRFEISDYKKNLVSANHAPPLEFCQSCSAGTPCQRQHAILTSSQRRRNVIEWEDLNILPALEVLLQIKSIWQNFEVIK